MMMSVGKILCRRAGRFLRDPRAVSAVEFAIILPLMLTLYIGTFEVSQAVTAKRKVTLTSHTVADLVARQSTISNTTMSDIFSATSLIMAPFPINNSIFTLVVSGVTMDAQSRPTIAWSCASDGNTYYTVGQSVTVPSALATPNGYLIWGKATYIYTPIIMRGSNAPFYTINGPITLTDQMYMAPRATPPSSC